MRSVLLLTYICFFGLAPVHGQKVYDISRSVLRFHSNAPHELIRASSDNLLGVVDIVKRTFFFKIGITSFTGFNSLLQKEHFNEDYMESELFPVATYGGKIIEEVDLSKDGEFDIRTKGKMTIHGIGRQCIIKCHIVSKKGIITATSDFVVLLSDYDIKVPRIVYDKLSSEINVSLNMVLSQRGT